MSKTWLWILIVFVGLITVSAVVGLRFDACGLLQHQSLEDQCRFNTGAKQNLSPDLRGYRLDTNWGDQAGSLLWEEGISAMAEATSRSPLATLQLV